jgi:peptidyl-dipeptidase A
MLCLRFLLPLALSLAAVVMVSCPLAALADAETTTRARQFVQAHEAKVRPLDKAASLAWWDANISGKDEDFKKKEEAQNRSQKGAIHHFDEPVYPRHFPFGK